ncbi:MAG TPA: hypothetical protein VNB94_11590 [Mycobacteriales bacterium]|nr:hypothetical protein [Mycobacteriales bacterium]
MTTRRTWLIGCALTCLAGTLAGPAAAAPNKNGPCKVPSGAFVLKAGQSREQEVATPVGAINSLASPTVDMATTVGDFYVDLAGRPAGTGGLIPFTLSWDNELSDYDLFINGKTELSEDHPESRVVPVNHCVKVSVKVDVFVGLPIDKLSLKSAGRSSAR